MKRQCSAMVWRSEELCYTPCKQPADERGFCRSHMTNRTNSGEVLDHWRIRLDKRSPFDLFDTAVSVIKTRQMRVTIQNRAREMYVERLEKVGVFCEECGKYILADATQMHRREITPKQFNFISHLLCTKQLTDIQRLTIHNRMQTHDMLWAFKAIHQLAYHTPDVDSLSIQARPF